MKIEARAKDLMAEMLLAEIRKLAGLTQVEAAKNMGISQSALSQLETQDDMCVSTLQRLVEALGGSLEITANLPAGRVAVAQFKQSA